jgi:hypothetical protein
MRVHQDATIDVEKMTFNDAGRADGARQIRGCVSRSSAKECVGEALHWQRIGETGENLREGCPTRFDLAGECRYELSLWFAVAVAASKALGPSFPSMLQSGYR